MLRFFVCLNVLVFGQNLYIFSCCFFFFLFITQIHCSFVSMIILKLLGVFFVRVGWGGGGRFGLYACCLFVCCLVLFVFVVAFFFNFWNSLSFCNNYKIVGFCFCLVFGIFRIFCFVFLLIWVPPPHPPPPTPPPLFLTLIFRVVILCVIFCIIIINISVCVCVCVHVC